MARSCREEDEESGLQTRWSIRISVVLLAVGLTLGAVELGLRLAWPALPSLSALEGVDRRDLGDFRRWTEPEVAYDADCRPLDPSREKQLPQRVSLVPAETWRGVDPASLPKDPPAEAKAAGMPRLWVVGDSVAQGWGVEPTRSYAWRLGGRWADLLKETVVVRQVGSPGLSTCGWVRDLHRTLDATAAEGWPRPDRVVLQVFADDLEERGVILVRGALVADPDHARPEALRPLLRRSYLANRLWYAQVGRAGAQIPERRGDAAQFLGAIEGLVARLDGEGIPWTLALVAPAGMARCEGATEAWSDCVWLGQDLERMAGWLGEAGLAYVDLRPVAALRAMDTLPDEEIAWVERGRLPVHPGPRGHALLGDALARELGWMER